jgi:TIR domain
MLHQSLSARGWRRNKGEKMTEHSSTDPNAAYKVFFSHKVEDYKVTQSIINLIERHTERVRCFMSENIEKGTNWREAIAEQLTHSSFLVLVFTDPNEDWAWCLYETGFFDALTRIPNTMHTRRIYCLHHASNPPPSPIADLQTVPAKVEDVSQWLKELFEHTVQTKEVFRDDIPQIAGQICELFERERKSIYSAKSMEIAVRRSSLESPDDLPNDTIIEGDQRLMEEVLGTNTGKIDWKSAKERFAKFPNSSEANLNALKEISRALYQVHDNTRVRPIQGTIFVEQGPKRYRPVISRAKELSSDRISCEILLIEEVGGPLQNVDKRLGALLTSIRMAVRIRWEIIRPFVHDSNIERLARDPRRLRLDLQTCLNNIFIEAEFRGIFSENDVWSAFESSADKSKIDAMIKNWKPLYSKIWQSLGFKNLIETFGEVSDQSFTDQDIASLGAGLQELEKMNSDFLDMAVARTEVLVGRELGIKKSLRALEASDKRAYTPKRRRAGFAKVA